MGDAVPAEEDRDEAAEAFKLLHHFNVSCQSLDFLLVEVFDSLMDWHLPLVLMRWRRSFWSCWFCLLR